MERAVVMTPPAATPVATGQTTDLDREFEEWDAIGEAATVAARKSLHEHGVRPVLMRHGRLLEELRDGTVQPLQPAGS